VITKYFQQFKNISSPLYKDAYWDSCHFQPYVYNELNKALLNHICAGK
jgi:hypothetical protein